MSTDPTIDAIESAIAEPKRARTAAGEVERHDLSEQVEAAKFARQARAADSQVSPFAQLRVAQVAPPGGAGT
jgi:hypothetical protein